MTPHELMIKTNHHLIKGGELTKPQKANIVRQFFDAQSSERAKQNFYKGVKYPGNKEPDEQGRAQRVFAERKFRTDKNNSGHMYPIFFLPPYNGNKKFQTVIPMSPKTHILSANSYELEIIRLLHLFAPNNTVVFDMVKKSLERLKKTCYGYHDCAVGECFHTALIVLRFIAATAPNDTEWINKLISFFKRNMDEKLALRGKGVHGNVLWYYWLCLSELPFAFAEPEIYRYKDKIIGQLNRNSVMNSESGKAYHPVMICAIRNTLSRLPDFAHIKNRQPYLSEKDGRLHFDMKKEQAY